MSTSPIPPILDQDRYAVYQPTAATTDFALRFPLFGEAADIAVYLNGNLLTLGTDYTVRSTANGASLTPSPVTDAYVRLSAAISSGKLEIYGNFRPRRTIQATAPYGTRDFNFSFSLLMAVLREMWSQFTRAIQAPVGEASLTLPSKAVRSGQVLGFDSNGNPAAVGDYASIATGAATATAAAKTAVDAATAAAAFDPARFSTKEQTAETLEAYVKATRKMRTGVGLSLNGHAGTDEEPAEADLTADLFFKMVFATSEEAAAGLLTDRSVPPAALKAAIKALGASACASLSGGQLAYVSTTTYSVTPGYAAAEGGSPASIALATSLTKSLSAWAAGAGAGSLDMGVVAANTWYHVHLIANAAGSAVDVLLSLSPTAPTMPAGYTSRRRIGSIRTNASKQITSFVQIGDDFFWTVPVADLSINPIPTTATLYALSVPSGVSVTANLTAQQLAIGTNYIGALLSPPDVPDIAPGAAANPPTGPFNVGVNLTMVGSMVSLRVRTDTASHIRVRANATNSNPLYVYTYGWTDDRGKL
jgi:hypothetical protein